MDRILNKYMILLKINTEPDNVGGGARHSPPKGRV